MGSENDSGEDPVVAYALATGALLAAACLMCIILMCCAKCPEWRRKRRQKRHRERLLTYCSKIRFSLKSCSTIGDTCAVCLEDFKDKEIVVVCPCKHGYHKNCLSDWVVHSPCCPLCKSLISSPLGARGCKVKEVAGTLRAAVPSESTPLMA